MTQSPPALRPHRGTLVLVFGILAIVGCIPLGIAAWVMANRDLAAMERGEMDKAGEGSTRAGRVCGMVGTGLYASAVGLHLLIFGVLSAYWVSQH